MSERFKPRRARSASALSGVCGLIAVVWLAGVRAVLAEPMVIGYGSVSGSVQHQLAVDFAEYANPHLPDNAQIQLLASSNYSDMDILWNVKQGTMHFALPSTVLSSLVDEFALFELPFLIGDRDHMARIERSDLLERLNAAAGRRGYRVLAMGENGFRHITNNTRAISTPGDLNGLVIRTPRSDWRGRMFRHWGAEVESMGFGKIVSAVLLGEIDGQENPLTNIWRGELHRVQSHLSLSAHVYSPVFLTVSRDWFDGLPPDRQAILRRAALAASAASRRHGEEQDADLVDRLAAAGMTVNTVDRTAFEAASAPLYQGFVDALPEGAALIEAATALRTP